MDEELRAAARSRRGRVVALDGPAASGKSTTARSVARRLGFTHVNSGLLYRAITWEALRRGWKVEDPDFGRRVEGLRVELAPGEPDPVVRVEGRRPGDDLMAEAVTGRVSRVARVAEVRAKVLERLRAAAERFDVVCDGRDIGTVVFPDAEVKIFLVAAVEERARRRLLDHGREPTPSLIEEEAERLRARDAMDAERELAPLRRAEDAVQIDTTDRTPEEVVARIVELAAARGLAPERAGGSRG